MLEFVHLTGAEAGKDLQTRRKVRSQAMRHYRARQREEKEAAKKPGQKKPPRSPRRSAVPTSEQGSPHPEAARSRAASTASSTSQAQPSLALEYDTTDGLLSVPYLHTAPANLDGHDHFGHLTQASFFPQQPIEQASNSNPYLTPDWMVHRSQSVARSESSWGSEIDDVFQNQTQVGQLLSFCQSCGVTTLCAVFCEECSNFGLFDRHALAGAWSR